MTLSMVYKNKNIDLEHPRKAETGKGGVTARFIKHGEDDRVYCLAVDLYFVNAARKPACARAIRAVQNSSSGRRPRW